VWRTTGLPEIEKKIKQMHKTGGKEAWIGELF